ncbi:hypothetical protein CCAE64S_02101 [Castellaniella caeni]
MMRDASEKRPSDFPGEKKTKFTGFAARVYKNPLTIQ